MCELQNSLYFAIIKYYYINTSIHVNLKELWDSDKVFTYHPGELKDSDKGRTYNQAIYWDSDKVRTDH